MACARYKREIWDLVPARYHGIKVRMNLPGILLVSVSPLNHHCVTKVHFALWPRPAVVGWAGVESVHPTEFTCGHN